MTKRITVPTTKTNLHTLLATRNGAHEYCQGVGLQARSTNSGVVRFAVGGGPCVQELVAGSSIGLGTNTPKSIWVESDNGTEEINVSLTVGANG